MYIQEQKVESITFQVYNNLDLENYSQGDCTYYIIQLLGMNVDEAINLKEAIQKIPNVGGVVDINLSNGNHI